jgi:hypothetical protein
MSVVSSHVQLHSPLDVIDPADRVRAFLAQVCCRHSYIRRSSSGRLFLECLHCQHATPGITTGVDDDLDADEIE